MDIMVEIDLNFSTNQYQKWFDWNYNIPRNKPYTESGYGWYYILDTEYHKWLKENNIKYELFSIGPVKSSDGFQYGVRFLNKEDAMLFKLTWF